MLNMAFKLLEKNRIGRQELVSKRSVQLEGGEGVEWRGKSVEVCLEEIEV